MSFQSTKNKKLSEQQIIDGITISKVNTETRIFIDDIGGVHYLMYFIIDSKHPKVIHLSWLEVHTGIDDASCYLLFVLKHLLRKKYINNSFRLVVKDPETTLQIRNSPKEKRMIVNVAEFGFKWSPFNFGGKISISIDDILSTLNSRCITITVNPQHWQSNNRTTRNNRARNRSAVNNRARNRSAVNNRGNNRSAATVNNGISNQGHTKKNNLKGNTAPAA